jgi:hypothetical protein
LHQKIQSNQDNNYRHHLDWDDAAAVERFLPILKQNLEANIQAASQQSAFAAPGGENNNSLSSGPLSSSSAPGAIAAAGHNKNVCLIRRLSVVMGRGFYTYCPGPPAPLVRVEYYNPSHRWKVKRALERGLDSLPPFYHPDPFQYDPFGRDNGPRGRRQQQRRPTMQDENDNDDNDDDIVLDDDAEIPEVLQFHCYEAHIPYTMQFFKDWNLAGMSYIHVKQGFFRNPLPKSFRPHHHQPHMASCDNEQLKVPTDYLFLQSNTPTTLRWPDTDGGGEQEDQGQQVVDGNDEIEVRVEESTDSFSPSSTAHHNNNAQTPVQPLPQQHQEALWDSQASSVPLPKHPPPKKETSCDVELDVSVD